MTYRNITLSGLTCSGATTLARLLSDKLGWPQVNPASESVRAFLQTHDLPLSDLGAFPDDDEIMNESMTADVLLNQSHMIIGGRLSGWLAQGMPDVFRIFVTADFADRAARFAKREHLTPEQAIQAVEKREATELAKYYRIYGADPRDKAIYNLTIDTTTTNADQTLSQALKALGAI